MNGIIGRWFFILMNLIAIAFDVYCIRFMIEVMMRGGDHATDHGFEEINVTLNGIGGVLIALGVLMESRITIMKMTEKPIDDLQHHLNESAEYCGMGLLLIGLFVEIFAVFIEVPNAVVNTKGIEIYLYSCCIFLIIISLIIEYAYIKDTIKSYFKTPPRVESTHE